MEIVALIRTTNWALLLMLLEPSEHLTEDVVHVGSLRSLGASEPVEILPLLRVGQDVIGALDLFELLWITAFVGMVLHSKFSVRLFYVSLRGALLDPQGSIGVHLF